MVSFTPSHIQSSFLWKVYEEEYYSSDEDEDLDDFVVSGDEEMEEGEEDVSSAIRQIFGYDRRR